jgi:hypothetical protein
VHRHRKANVVCFVLFNCFLDRFKKRPCGISEGKSRVRYIPKLPVANYCRSDIAATSCLISSKITH